nr:MFS transporter [Motilibacter aurantiacus]
MSGYVSVLRTGRAARPFLAAVVARLSLSMAPLSAVLLVNEVRGDYGEAGLVTGAYALGTAAGSPLWGRALDRLGQARVIAPTGVVSALLLAVLALTAAADAPVPLLLLLAASSGAFFPPLSPAMRAAWRVIFSDEGRRRAGYALDAVAVETIFIGGPLLLSLLLTTTGPAVPLIVTSVLLGLGSLAYASTDAARSWRPVPAEEQVAAAGGDRPVLAVPGMAALLTVGVCLALLFGCVDTSIASTARDVLDDESTLGLLFAAIAGGSAIGGLLYGALAGHEGEQRRLPLTLVAIACGLAAVGLVLRADPPPLAPLLLLLFVSGLCIAPTLLILQNLVDVLAPRARVNEAQAWLSMSNTAGAAGGTAIAGIVIDAGGVSVSMSTGAGFGVLAAVVALTAQRAWRRGHAAATGNGAAAMTADRPHPG